MDLETSWSNYYIRTMNSTTIPGRESMESIAIHCVYIDIDGTIRRVDRATEIVIDGILSECRILQLMQTKRDINGTRYKLDEIITYFITLEPSQISSFIQFDAEKYSTESLFGFGLKSYLLPCDISIPSSIFVFHPLNGIWFLFREMTLVYPVSRSLVLKSCLKKDGITNKTKKVRICLDHSPRHGKTRRNI